MDVKQNDDYNAPSIKNSEGYGDPVAFQAMKNVLKEEAYKRKIQRGEIYYVTLTDTCGSEQRAGRPAVIVSNDQNNAVSPTVEVVYLTSKMKKELPTHVDLHATGRDSIALCEQIFTVDKRRVGSFISFCSEQEMYDLDDALVVSLGLDYCMGYGSEDGIPYEEQTAEATSRVEAGESAPEHKGDVGLEDELVAAKAQLQMIKGMYDELLHKVIGS